MKKLPKIYQGELSKIHNNKEVFDSLKDNNTEIKEVKVKNETKYYCDLGITIDERISDGFYLIKSIHMMQYILSNPKLLEDKITEKITLPE